MCQAQEQPGFKVNMCDSAHLMQVNQQGSPSQSQVERVSHAETLDTRKTWEIKAGLIWFPADKERGLEGKLSNSFSQLIYLSLSLVHGPSMGDITQGR